MSPAILSIVIILVALVLYMIPKIPIAMTSIAVMVAMVLGGVMTFGEVSAGFSNSVIFMIAGMMIVGRACVDTGITYKIGNVLYKAVGDREKLLVLLLFILGAVLGLFLGGSIITALMMPIIDSIVLRSNGKVTRKHTYMVAGLSGVMGNNLTTFSTSSMLTCVGILTAAGYREMGMFEPTKIALPALIATVAVYYFFIYDRSKKWLDYPDPPVSEESMVEYDASRYPVWKQWVSGITMIAVIIGLVAGMNMAVPPLIGALVVILTGCIGEKDAYKSVSWSTLIVAGASIGFSAGLTSSGGGALIAEFMMKVTGPLGQTPFGMMVILFIIANLLSQVMADSGTVACMAPITMAICQAQGWDAVPMILMVALGIKMALATPICVVCMTQVLPGGYRFKDYLKIGGIVTIVECVVMLVMAKIIYY